MTVMTASETLSRQTLCRTPSRSDITPPTGALVAALHRLYGQAPDASVRIDVTPETPNADQRQFPRRTAAGLVTLVRSSPDMPLDRATTDWLLRTSGLTGELVDLSRSGVALVLVQPLELGDTVIVRLSQQDRPESLETAAEVIRVVDLGDQRWKIMARFAKPLGFDEAYQFANHDQGALPLFSGQ